MVVLPVVLIGNWFNSATVVGLLLVSTAYSKAPIFEVPEGRTRFCALIALTTSRGESPFDWSALVSRSTCPWRCFPPYGYGMAHPGTVIKRVRMKFTP